MKMFKKGMRAVIKETSGYFRSQGMHGEGRIDTCPDNLEGWYTVVFPDGYVNSYKHFDLDVFDDVTEAPTPKDKKLECCGQPITPIKDGEVIGECAVCGIIYLTRNRTLKNAI